MLPASELILHPDGSVYHLGLRPEDVADTVLVVGDPERVARITRHFDRIERRVQRREFVTHTGQLGPQRLTVISSGIGTDNVEILLTELDALVNVDLARREIKAEKKRLRLIRIGTSGSLQPDVPVDSHLCAASAIGLDTLMCFYPLPQIEAELVLAQRLQQHLGLPFRPYCVSGSAALRAQFGPEMIEGHTLTCPGFYAPQGRQIRLSPAIPALVAALSGFRQGDYRLTNFEMETAGYYALCRMLGHDAISLNAIVAHRLTHEFSSNPEKVVDDLIRNVLEKI